MTKSDEEIVERMGLHVQYIQEAPTVTAGAYSAGDAVGGLLVFRNVSFEGGGRSRRTSPKGSATILDSVVIVDRASQDVQLDLVLFSEEFTPTADNGAFDPSDADLLNCIGVVKVSDYSAFNDNSIATKSAIGLPIHLTNASGNLFGQLVTRGTPTYVAITDIAVRIGLISEG